MMCPDLIRAKQILQTEGCTCVLCSDNTIYRSSIRGVKPLLELIETDTDTTGFSAADKVVDTAAAMLYCHLRVRQVYASVMSRGNEIERTEKFIKSKALQEEVFMLEQLQQLRDSLKIGE